VTAELLERLHLARAAWLEVEHLAGALEDDELEGRVACARLAILDVRDRAEQLDEIDRELREAAA
jgi:hypothetical protein